MSADVVRKLCDALVSIAGVLAQRVANDRIEFSMNLRIDGPRRRGRFLAKPLKRLVGVVAGFDR